MTAHRLSGRLQSRRAFSLVEIALALGIAGFALVAIIGMLPVAVENARESRLQTRAAFVARAIFEDLQAGADGNVVVRTGNAGTQADFEVVKLEPALNRTFNAAFDEEGNMLNSPGNFVTGSGMPGNALFATELTLRKPGPDPAEVELSVETPAIAKRANRRKYLFVSRILR